MGSVYRARSEALGREVAIKILEEGALHPVLRGRFAEEARVMARLPHPAIVGVLQADLEATPPYLVQDLMAGGSLDDRVRAGPTPPEVVIAWGARLFDALAHLHGEEVLHRDIKPANILLDGAGLPYLADFGLAREGEGPGFTATGCMVGTPRYMAPELFLTGTYSEASDVFALGYSLLEAAVGETVGSDLAVRDREVMAASTRVEPPELKTLLRRTLRSAPADRAADAAELAGEFAALLPAGSTREGPLPAPARPVDLATASLIAAPVAATSPPTPPSHGPALALVFGVLVGAVLGWGPPHAAARPPADPVAEVTPPPRPASRVVARFGVPGHHLAKVFHLAAGDPGPLRLETRTDRADQHLTGEWEPRPNPGETPRFDGVVEMGSRWVASVTYIAGTVATARGFATWEPKDRGQCHLRVPVEGRDLPEVVASSSEGLLVGRGRTISYYPCDEPRATGTWTIPEGAVPSLARDGVRIELPDGSTRTLRERSPTPAAL